MGNAIGGLIQAPMQIIGGLTSAIFGGPMPGGGIGGYPSPMGAYPPPQMALPPQQGFGSELESMLPWILAGGAGLFALWFLMRR